MNPVILDEMLTVAAASGGCIKFDLKAWNEPLHVALTGTSGSRTRENFQRAAIRARERAIPPLVIASTLLVPGYVDEEEVRQIARFIASVNPDVPYTLLAFHPQFYLSDLPVTSRDLALDCAQIAQDEGLTNIKIGNMHLLV
jgi:pyruvate formate lyase activating enzyme